MSSSGTYAFQASNGELVLAAYERCQLRAPSLRQEHFVTARRELNFLQSSFSNLQPNLWKVELLTQVLTAGTATYDIPARVVMILDAYVSINTGSTNQSNRILSPISRSDFAAYPQPQQQGEPNVFWFNRQIDPTITFYPVPDSNGPYQLNYYACSQMQDANLAGGETPDVPYLWLDALVAGLAHRVARVYAPSMEQIRKMDAKEAWDIAATQNVENIATSFGPSVGAYYPR